MVFQIHRLRFEELIGFGKCLHGFQLFLNLAVGFPVLGVNAPSEKAADQVAGTGHQQEEQSRKTEEKRVRDER